MLLEKVIAATADIFLSYPALRRLNRTDMLVIMALTQYPVNGMFVTALAKCVGVSTPQVSRVVHDLLVRGFVDRCIREDDRRLLQIKLTTRGHEIVRFLADSIAIALVDLSPQEREAVRRFLGGLAVSRRTERVEYGASL